MVKSKKTKTDESLFFFAFSLYMFASFINISLYTIYLFSFVQLSYILCAVVLLIRFIITSEGDIKHWLITFMAGIICLIIISTASDLSMGVAVFMIYSGKNYSFNKILRTGLFISIIMSAFVVFSMIIGIITNYVYNQDGRIRSTLGFRYVLYLPAIICNIISN